jgi:uncharacterized glyoxalase superfamily protein PhnB/ketosteroid isomerase-like protein
MSHSTSAAVWPILTYRDAPRAIKFMQDAFGLEEGVVFTLEDNPSVVSHAEMRWPQGGGVMFGSAGKDDSAFGQRAPGNDSVYLVCDDPDGLYARATAAGAQVVSGLKDESYGSRGFTVRDPEGNLWSFGTYGGEGAPAPSASELPALLEAWAAAIVSNDAEAIGSFMAPDWVIVGQNGMMTRDAFLALVASGDLTHAAMQFDVHRVDIYDDVAVVIAHGTNNGHFRGAPFQSDEWVSDVFVRRGDKWLCVHTQLTPVGC